MPIVSIDSLDDPRIADYRAVSDPELLRWRGLFVAEGRLVVRTMLEASRFRPRSLLVTEQARLTLAGLLEPLGEALTVHVASVELLSAVVGFNVHRGCLALVERPAPVAVNDLLVGLPRRATVVLLEGVGNADNVGGIFRNALAFGAAAIVLGPGCCDPLYRKATRVSIGATLRVPFATTVDWPADLERLRDSGFTVVALTPDPTAEDVSAFATAAADSGRVALLLGAEGPGLTPASLAAADRRVRIPMAGGVDSINVATAAAIVLHRLGPR